MCVCVRGLSACVRASRHMLVCVFIPMVLSVFERVHVEPVDITHCRCVLVATKVEVQLGGGQRQTHSGDLHVASHAQCLCVQRMVRSSGEGPEDQRQHMCCSMFSVTDDTTM